MTRGCRRVAVIILATSAALTVAATGHAHDSLAPPGSPHTWLPGQKWVAGHWVPFDEQALKVALGLRGRELEAFLYDDHHTLAQLARRRGIGVERLADRLVAPWGLIAGDNRLILLRDHAVRILTQGHLAQHAFFHLFHGVPVADSAQSIFGVSRSEYLRLRLRGRTPMSIARRAGVPFRAVRRGMIDLFRAQRAAGIRLGLAWAPESGRIFRRQMRALTCWLRRPIAEDDPANPYGKARLQHGSHKRGWPRTPAARRRDERRVERVRRSLRHSCWRPPPAWNRRREDDRGGRRQVPLSRPAAAYASLRSR